MKKTEVSDYDEYSQDIKDRFKEILKKEQQQQELTIGEISMLFFWQNHKSEPRFSFLRDYIKEPNKTRQRLSNGLKTKHK